MCKSELRHACLYFHRMTFPEILDLNGLVDDDTMPPTPGPKTDARKNLCYCAPANINMYSRFVKPCLFRAGREAIQIIESYVTFSIIIVNNYIEIISLILCIR